jgi:hypothetical protein
MKNQADFDKRVTVRVFIKGRLAGSEARPFRELQNF